MIPNKTHGYVGQEVVLQKVPNRFRRELIIMRMSPDSNIRAKLKRDMVVVNLVNKRSRLKYRAHDYSNQ